MADSWVRGIGCGEDEDGGRERVSEGVRCREETNMDPFYTCSANGRRREVSCHVVAASTQVCGLPLSDMSDDRLRSMMHLSILSVQRCEF